MLKIKQGLGKKLKAFFLNLEDSIWSFVQQLTFIGKISQAFKFLYQKTYCFLKIDKLKNLSTKFYVRFKEIYNNFLTRIKTQSEKLINKLPFLVNFYNIIKQFFQKINSRLPTNKSFLAILGINLLFLICGVIVDANFIFILAILTWINIFIYALKKMRKCSMLLCFSVTFFVFLLGREFLQQFLNYKVQDFGSDVLNHTHFSLLLCLLCLIAGYILTKTKFAKIGKNAVSATALIQHADFSVICSVSRTVLLFLAIPAIIYRTVIFIFVQQNGYFAYYTDFPVMVNSNLILFAFSKLDQMLPVSMCIYMASIPEKSKFYHTFSVYAVYLLLTLGGGGRSTLILGIFLYLFYLIYRSGINPEENWFKRKYLIVCVVVLFIFAMISYFGGLVRDGLNSNDDGLIDGIFGFLYSQGVSINVLKQGYIFQDYIPEGYLYTMEFTRSGIIARLLDIPIYHGNTIEHALYGGSFTHSLSYLALEENYLNGRGLGSSFIAELYQDFGYIGIAVGSFFYGWLCAKIDTYKANKVYTRACLFIMLTQVLWAPRGSFSGMITTLISPASLVMICSIFGLSFLLNRRRKWCETHNER